MLSYGFSFFTLHIFVTLVETGEGVCKDTLPGGRWLNATVKVSIFPCLCLYVLLT